MSTTAHYHPRGIDIDLVALSPWLYAEIASLQGHIDRKDPPVFTCLGNQTPMYVYLHHTGRYYLRHFENQSCGRSHVIATMSDEHRRQAEYTQRAAVDNGFNAELEVPTGNGTRLDVGVFGQQNIGFEIQRSNLSRANAKTRAWKSYRAGWPTAWISDRQKDPDWVNDVPTARLTVRHTWVESLPPRNTQNVIISEFTRERDSSKPSGWRYVRMPRPILLDELACQMPTGDIVPVVIGSSKKRAVVLAPKYATELIDSCTYPGASSWRPDLATLPNKQEPHYITRECAHREPVSAPLPAAPPPASANKSQIPRTSQRKSTTAITIKTRIGPGRCPGCGWHPSHHLGHAPDCPNPDWPTTPAHLKECNDN